MSHPVSVSDLMVNGDFTGLRRKHGIKKEIRLGDYLDHVETMRCVIETGVTVNNMVVSVIPLTQPK